MWIVVLLVVLILFLVLKNIGEIRAFKRRLNFSKTIPGPGFFELIENARKRRLIYWLKDNADKFGKVYRIWFGQDLNIFFTDPQDVKTILSSTSQTHGSRVRELLVPWLGRGLLTNYGENWHQKRKMITPAFHFTILSTFKGVMEDCCDILIDKLNKIADRTTIDIYPYITLFALDVIYGRGSKYLTKQLIYTIIELPAETAMGLKVNAQNDKNSEIVQSTKLICRLIHEQMFSLWKSNSFLFSFSESARQRDSAITILHNETGRVIKLRRSQMDEQATVDPQLASNDVGSKRRLAFLDSLLLAQKENGCLTDVNIQEEVDTFMFAGHDTTSSAIAFTVYLLSQNSDVQQKAFAEVLEFNGSDAMPYLEAVIKESLRLYPPVPSYSRVVKDQFQVGNLNIPSGTFITVLAYAIHRDPEIYPEPEKFKPERFLNDQFIPNFGHIPFGAGPRNCIGQKFAMLELKCTLSKLVRAFEFLPVAGFVPHVVPELILKSLNGIQVQLRKRC